MTDDSGSKGARSGSEEDPDRVVIRDKRRVHSEPGEAKAGASGGEAPAQDVTADDVSGEDLSGDAATTLAGDADLDAVSDDPLLAELSLQVQERTADLQRLSAEFANYRKRVERDRELIAEAATGSVLAAFLPVLDDIDRARDHGDLVGGLKSVADQIEGALERFGLAAFGEVGDPFDPTIHEAVMHDSSPDVEAPTCTTVMRKGYRMGERLLRPAMVGVSDPA